MIWYPVFGAGMSAVGTLASVLAFALPYWIQLEKSVSVSGNGVTDVYIKFTHGLWQYCNLVTTSSQETEKCGSVQSHSDMDQVTECLVALSIILSTNVVVQIALYLSKIELTSGQNLSLYLAMGSAGISSVLLASGLVVYSLSDHDIRITDEISLEFSASSLYACYWLAVAGCVAIASSILFIVLTIWTKQKSYQTDTSSLMSSKSSLKSLDNFTIRTKFSDHSHNTSPPSSSSESSDEEEQTRAPHPFISKAPIKASSLADIRVGKDEHVKREAEFESDTDDILKGDIEKDDESVNKMKVYIPDSDGKLEEYERIALSPETLTDIDDLSKHDDDDFDEFYQTRAANLSEERGEKTSFVDMQIKLPEEDIDDIIGVQSDGAQDEAEDQSITFHDRKKDETEKLPSGDSTDTPNKIDLGEADHDNVSVKLDLSGERIDTPPLDIADEGILNDSSEEHTDDSDEDRQINDQDRQFQLSGQQLESARSRIFGLNPGESESARSLKRETSNPPTPSHTTSTFKYLAHHVSNEHLTEESSQEDTALDDYPISFEDEVVAGKPPTDTRGMFAPVVLASKKESLFKLPTVLKEQRSRKRKKPKKPVFCDIERMQTTYDKPVWQIPQYPEVPFLKQKRKRGSPKAKKKVPTFKDTILRFKSDFKQHPPKADDSEC